MGKRLVKIQLYSKTKSKEQVLKKHGDYILDDICISCTVEEDFLTTEHFLDAEFLVDEKGLFKHLEEDAILKVQMDYGEDIFSIVDVKKTTTRVIVFARQITITESICSWLEDVRPEGKNGQDTLNHMGDGAVGHHNLEFESDISKKNTAYYQNKSLYDALHTASNCFMTRWGGEMRRRGYKIIINEKIGEETGVQIRSGKNLIGFEATTNIDKIVTRIRPVGFNGITTEDYIDSPLINNYKYIRTQEVKYEHVKLRSDLETEPDEDGEVQTQEPDEGDLVFDTLAEAQAKLTELALLEYLDNLFDVLQADYTVNFVDLSKTEEYKNYAAAETVQLGDSINVYEEKHDINIKVRAIKRKFNVLSQKIEEIELSNKTEVERGPEEIEQLKSRLDTVVEQIGYMNVAYAKIEDLEAIHIQVEDLEANKANIKDLTVVEADIEKLDVQVATIQTLVNGNLTSDNIHSLILTSEKVSVDNGFIKNAMIDTLNADKINGGSIDTNNVNIMSDDGTLQIIGDLMQFKDENGNVRIQMGRDTSGDFTFILYDETGQGQLLNKDGITASAIADGLIVNDMVAGNANISGSKLDIDSVIKVINEDGSETIKSNRIYLDEQNQSLEVAFNNLTTKVETLEGFDGDVGNLVETVNTHTTSLEVLQGEINTLISDTTITKENGQKVTLKDDYSSFKQTVDGIESKVGSLESNYKKTLKSTKTMYYVSTSATALEGGNWSETSPTWEEGKYIWQKVVYIYTDDTQAEGTAVCIQGAKGEDGEAGEKGQSVVSVTPQFQAGTSSTTAPTGSWLDTCPAYTVGKYLWIRNKVVYANPTETKYTTPYYDPSWDAKSIADEASKTVTAKVSEFSQTLNGFETRVSATEATANEAKTAYSTLSQTVNGFETRVSATEATANEAKSAASTLTQTVNSFEAAIEENGKKIASLELSNEGFEVAIGNKADSSNIISTINASKENIKISSSKINITGFVEFSDLSTAGYTTINGANITTGYISGDRIKGGTITATKEINFECGARIFGNTGEFGAGLTISAAGFSLSGGTANFLGGSWFCDTDIEADGYLKADKGITSGGSISCTGLSSSGGVAASGNMSCNVMYPTSISATSTISTSGNMSASGTITAGGTTQIGNYSIWLGTRNETVSCAAVKMGTGGYMAAYAGFHFVNSSGSPHSLRAGTIYQNGTVVTSDARKKMDIRYVDKDKQSTGESGLMSPNVNITTSDMHEFISTIPLTSYRYVDEVNDNRNFTHYGFLTQDVLYTKVGSELVAMMDEMKQIGDEDDFMGYSQDKLIAFLCGALQKEIELRQALEAKVDSLMDASNK